MGVLFVLPLKYSKYGKISFVLGFLMLAQALHVGGRVVAEGALIPESCAQSKFHFYARETKKNTFGTLFWGSGSGCAN